MSPDPFRGWNLAHPEVHAWVTATFRVKTRAVPSGALATVLLGLDAVAQAVRPTAAAAVDAALEDADFRLRAAIREEVESAA